MIPQLRQQRSRSPGQVVLRGAASGKTWKVPGSSGGCCGNCSKGKPCKAGCNGDCGGFGGPQALRSRSFRVPSPGGGPMSASFSGNGDQGNPGCCDLPGGPGTGGPNRPRPTTPGPTTPGGGRGGPTLRHAGPTTPTGGGPTPPNPGGGSGTRTSVPTNSANQRTRSPTSLRSNLSRPKTPAECKKAGGTWDYRCRPPTCHGCEMEVHVFDHPGLYRKHPRAEQTSEVPGEKDRRRLASE